MLLRFFLLTISFLEDRESCLESKLVYFEVMNEIVYNKYDSRMYIIHCLVQNICCHAALMLFNKLIEMLDLMPHL